MVDWNWQVGVMGVAVAAQMSIYYLQRFAHQSCKQWYYNTVECGIVLEVCMHSLFHGMQYVFSRYFWHWVVFSEGKQLYGVFPGL